MLSRIGRWVDDRLTVAAATRSALDHVVPRHRSFLLGEVALHSFVVLVPTGTFRVHSTDPTGDAGG